MVLEKTFEYQNVFLQPLKFETRRDCPPEAGKLIFIRLRRITVSTVKKKPVSGCLSKIISFAKT